MCRNVYDIFFLFEAYHTETQIYYSLFICMK